MHLAAEMLGSPLSGYEFIYITHRGKLRHHRRVASCLGSLAEDFAYIGFLYVHLDIAVALVDHDVASPSLLHVLLKL